MERKVTAAFGWKFFERISVQGTNFLVTLLLARLLTPSDYGTVSIVTIFIALPQHLFRGDLILHLFKEKMLMVVIISRSSHFLNLLQ